MLQRRVRIGRTFDNIIALFQFPYYLSDFAHNYSAHHYQIFLICDFCISITNTVDQYYILSWLSIKNPLNV